jgi:hypothetical protein
MSTPRLFLDQPLEAGVIHHPVTPATGRRLEWTEQLPALAVERPRVPLVGDGAAAPEEHDALEPWIICHGQVHAWPGARRAVHGDPRVAELGLVGDLCGLGQIVEPSEEQRLLSHGIHREGREYARGWVVGATERLPGQLERQPIDGEWGRLDGVVGTGSRVDELTVARGGEGDAGLGVVFHAEIRSLDE